MKKFLVKIKKNQRVIVAILFLLGIFVVKDFVMAQNDAGTVVKEVLEGAGGLVAGTIGGVIAIVVGAIASMITAITGLLITVMIRILADVATFNNIIDVPPVMQGWVIVRDLANMFFVLIFLVIAFSTILRIENYSAKKNLPKLLVMAVMIKFSKTIFGLLIDFSTLVMLTFTHAISGGGYFISIFRIDNLLSFPEASKISEGKISEGFTESALSQWTTVLAIIASVVAALIVLIVVTVILAVLVMRVIFLWIYTILSPLVFLGWAFPPLSKYTEQIWSDFIKQLIVGPILGFFLWLALFNMQGDAFKEGYWLANLNLTANQATHEVCAGSAFFCNKDFMRFLLSIGFLIGGLMTAQQVGGASSKIIGQGKAWADKTIKGASSAVKSSAKGTAEFSARYGANKLINSGPMQKLIGDTKLGKLATVMNNESYDGYKKNSVKKVKGIMEKVMGEKGANSFMKQYGDSSFFAGSRNKNKAVVDRAKLERDRKINDARQRLKNDNEAELQKKKDQEKALLERKKEDAKKIEDDFARSTNGAMSDSDRQKFKKDRNDRISKLDELYKADMERVNNEYTQATTGPQSEFDIAEKRAYDEYKDSIKGIKNEKKRHEKLDKLDEEYFENGVLRTGKTQDEYDKSKGLIDKQHDGYYNDGFIPGKLIMEAAAEIAKEFVSAEKGRDALASGATDIMDYKKGELISAKGLSAAQNKFYDAIASGDEKSRAAVASMVKSLESVRTTLERTGKLSEGQLSTLHGLKLAFAHRAKAGKDNTMFSPAISIIDNITTGDGSKAEHSLTVAQLKDKI